MQGIWDWNTPTRREATEYSSSGVVHLWVCPLCELSDYTVVSIALDPTLTMDMPAIGPGVSQVLFLPGHHHRSTEVRSWDCSDHGSGPAVGTMGAAQTLA